MLAEDFSAQFCDADITLFIETQGNAYFVLPTNGMDILDMTCEQRGSFKED